MRAILAQNLRALMGRRGWGQEKVGAKAGMSQTHVGNIVRQEVDPTAKILAALGRAFDLPPWLLLVPDLPPEILDSKEIPSLIKTYVDESSKPLSVIIAQRAARAT